MTPDPSQLAAPPPDDFTLLAAVAAGDAAAFETLYDRHSPVVFALCARIVGDRSEAEDVLIDVFDQIWTRGGGQFDPARGAPITYILTIARSHAIDRLRSRRGRLGFAAVGDGQAGPLAKAVARSAESAAADGPVGRLMADEEAQRVRTALTQLDAGQQQAIELSFFDGLSHAQIAQRVGRPLGTIKTMIRQGLIQLRQSVRTLEEGGPKSS